MTENVKHTRVTEFIHAGRLVVAVEVDALIYPGDCEESLQPQTVDFLDEVQRRAEAGDREWLRKVGRVYVLESAA